MVDGKKFLHDLGRAADFVTDQRPETPWAQVLMQFLLSLIRLVQARNIKCFWEEAVSARPPAWPVPGYSPENQCFEDSKRSIF